MKTLYEDDELILTISDITYDKYAIFCNSASGLPGMYPGVLPNTHSKPDRPLDGIFTPMGINEINFFCKRQSWFQSPGTSQCVTILKQIIKGCERNTVIYGYSMGGFAAIHFGCELGITPVAFSPQATLGGLFDEDLSLWKMAAQYADEHWGGFKSNIVNGKWMKSDIYIYIYYDSRHVMDKDHNKYIIKHCPNCISFNIPYGGHACSAGVNPVYSIKRIIEEIINHTFDEKKFRKEFFLKYNLPEKKLLDPYKYFSYLCSLVQEKDFKIYIGLLRARKYHDLVARLLIFLEKRYPEYLDKCIECMLDVKMIAYHNALIGKHEYTLATSNIRERMIVCASFYFNRKKYIRAEKLYGQLYNVDNHSDEIAVNFARTLYRLDKIDHAIDLLLEHMEFNGSTPLCLGYVGIFLFCKKMYPDCRKFLSRALHDEENGLFRIFYARSLREEGTISAAAAYLKRHAADHSVSGEYMAHLGAYLVMSGMEEEGLAYLEDAKKRKGCPGWVNGRIKQAHEALKREGE